MKKLIVLALVFLCALGLVGCNKSEGNDYPYYFIGEIVGEDTLGCIVKVVDYGNHKFISKEVIMHEVKLGQEYSVGDHIRVEFGGVFLQSDPPQIKSAISIEKTDSVGNGIE